MIFAKVQVYPDSAKSWAEGLVQLRLSTPADFAPQAATISWGGNSVRLKIGPEYQSAGELCLNLNTHLLRNGRHTIEICLEASTSKRAASTDLNVQNHGPLANQVTAALLRHKVPIAFTGPIDTRIYPFGDSDLVPWFDRPDALARIDTKLDEQKISSKEAAILKSFVEDGYVEIPTLIDAELLARMNQDLDTAIDQHYRGYEYGSNQRLEHLHMKFESFRQLWLASDYLKILRLIFGTSPRPCQTLTYAFGSEQDVHQDTVLLTPFPAGYMCGVWIALQDITPESGELIVYPKSHRAPRVYMESASCAKVVNGQWGEFGQRVVSQWRELAKSYSPRVYRPKKGSALIWHENLLHAGSPRVDRSLERRSVVIHAFAQGGIFFYDSTGEVAVTEIQPLRADGLGLTPDLKDGKLT